MCPFKPEKFKLHGLGSPMPRPDIDRESAYQRGYNNRWRKHRNRYMVHHPFCVECALTGINIKATDLDHVIPHRGNKMIFWDQQCIKCGLAKGFGMACPVCNEPSNLQALCKSHHSAKTMRGE